MSLQNWLQMGHLVEHEATVAEVRSLLGVIDRELKDASVTGLSDEGRFTHAYDAGFLLCKLALHASGFELQKSVRSHHSYWINSLEFTLGKEQKEMLIHLSKSSTLRHTSLYDQAGIIQKQDADDLVVAVRQLRTDVLAWLHSRYPNLIPKGH